MRSAGCPWVRLILPANPAEIKSQRSTQSNLFKCSLKTTFKILLHERLNCFKCADTIAPIQVGSIIIKTKLAFTCCGYALALHATFGSLTFVVLFYLCGQCCGGDGSRQSATTSVGTRRQPRVAAAGSSPPAS